MDEKEKRKILISSILIIITLILVVVGTTYAFFSLQIQNSSEPTNIEITTGEQNEITLSGGITGYHINLDVSDMTKDKVGKSYYGTTTSNKNYETYESSGTETLGKLTISGELNDIYECTAKINISLDGDMQEFLQANDLVLVVIKPGGGLSIYDLSETLDNPNIRFNIYDSNIEPIKAYLKFTNQDTDQSDLAGKELNISIGISDFACEIKELHPNVKLLLEKGEGTFKEKSGMLRFIGTNEKVTNNYICFGTDDTDTCKGSPEDYMYRIIGMTSNDDNTINLPANSLKIIKATPSSESQQWHNVADDTKWDDSDMKTYLNGTFYNSIKNAQPNGTYWDSIILSHSWYNADYTSVPAAEPTTSHTVESKIGLMYATDYKNSGDQNTNNWLFIKNGWSTNSSLSGSALYEWTMSRYGFSSYYGNYLAWVVFTDGTLNWHFLTYASAARPVFYVSPDITLTGEGNTENPFIIHSWVK